MALLSQQDIDNFNKDWTIKIGPVLMDITQVAATNITWNQKEDPTGKAAALEIIPFIDVNHATSLESGKVKICNVQQMISDTPPDCLWGPNYLRIPMTPQGKTIARLILNKIKEYEDYCHEMNEIYSGIYNISNQ